MGFSHKESPVHATYLEDFFGVFVFALSSSSSQGGNGGPAVLLHLLPPLLLTNTHTHTRIYHD